MLAVVQAVAAQLGVVARADLQTMALKRYGPRVAGVLLVSVVVVNVVTIAADLQAGAAGIGLLADVDPRWPVLPLGLALARLLLIGKYDEVVAVLRYLLLGFLAFAGQPWWLIRTGPACSKAALYMPCRCGPAPSPVPSPCSAPP